MLTLMMLSGFAYADGERTFESLFEGTDEAVLEEARGAGYSQAVEDVSALAVKPLAEINMVKRALETEPSYLIESLSVINKAAAKLGIYNALLKVSTLKGRRYFSNTRNRETVLFEEASIIASESDNKRQSDPPNAAELPASRTVFIAVKDANFGNCYYKAEISTEGAGIRFVLSNFRAVNYLFIPVIKPEKLLIQLYLEPIGDSVVLYGLTGVDTADFAAKHVDVASAIGKRLDIIYKWIADNLG
jgi:hypothetical protein